MNILIEAVRSGTVADVKKALDEGIDVDVRDPVRRWRTAIHAVAFDRADVLPLLLDAGAELEGYEQVLARAQPKTTTLLHAAAAFGSPNVIGVLLDRGISVDLRDDIGATPLLYAVEEAIGLERKTDPVAAMKVLLARGADPNARSTDGRSPIDTDSGFVVMNSGLEKFDTLLEAGADPRAAARLWQGLCIPPRWPYQLACKLGILERLARVSFDPHAIPGALQSAARVPEILAWAIARGEPSTADVDAALEDAATYLVDKPFATVLRDILKRKSPSTEGLSRALMTLLTSAATPSTAKLSAETAKSVKALIGAGASAAIADDRFEGMTALHAAAKLGNPPDRTLAVLESCLGAAPDAAIDAVDAFGRTPLHLAVWCGAPKNVERLLAAGADPTRRSKEGLDAWGFYTTDETRAVLERIAGPRKA